MRFRGVGNDPLGGTWRKLGDHSGQPDRTMPRTALERAWWSPNPAPS